MQRRRATVALMKVLEVQYTRDKHLGPYSLLLSTLLRGGLPRSVDLYTMGLRVRGSRCWTR